MGDRHPDPHYRWCVIEPDSVLTVDEARCRARDGVKWSKHGPEVVPAWVSDMDFDPPAPVLEGLRGHLGAVRCGAVRCERRGFARINVASSEQILDQVIDRIADAVDTRG